MTLDDPFVSQIVFHPRPEDCGHAPRGMPTLTQCDGAVVGGYFHANPASDRLLLFFHGNGELAADYDSLRTIYTDCGASCWMVDYRGYGRSTGVPSFSRMIRDAEALLHDAPRIAENAGLQFAHVLVMGRSLGSASALHLASSCAELLDGLILDSPYADGLALIHRLGGPLLEREALPGFEDNWDRMRRCTIPCLIIHGSDDHIIPFAEAEALYGICGSSSKELLRIDGAGHNDLLLRGFENYTRTLNGFVMRATRSS